MTNSDFFQLTMNMNDSKSRNAGHKGKGGTSTLVGGKKVSSSSRADTNKTYSAVVTSAEDDENITAGETCPTTGSSTASHSTSALSDDDGNNIFEGFFSSDSNDALYKQTSSTPVDPSDSDPDRGMLNKRTKKLRRRKSKQRTRKGSLACSIKSARSSKTEENETDGVVQPCNSADHSKLYLHILQNSKVKTLAELDEVVKSFSDASCTPVTWRKVTSKMSNEMFRYVRYHCTHAGSYRLRNSNAPKRDVLHSSKECKANINCKFDCNRNCYVLGKYELQHNHIVGKKPYAMYPRQRNVTTEQASEADRLMRLDAKSAKIAESFLERRFYLYIVPYSTPLR